MACAFFDGDFYFILKSIKLLEKNFSADSFPKKISEQKELMRVGRETSKCMKTVEMKNGSIQHVEFEKNIDQLASSGKGKDSHMGMVTKQGMLLMCGKGDYGQLGLGDTDNRTTPTLVSRTMFDGEPVLMVACGFLHTVVLTKGGGVYTFGKGVHGRLGHGDQESLLVPRQVPASAFNGDRVVMVAAGFAHTVALSEAGHVFTWGLGADGQLGHGDQEHQRAPRQVEAGRFGGEKVVFVAAGGYHTVAVTAGGRLYTWGDGENGQLGHGDTDSRLVPTLVTEGAEAFGAPAGERVVMAACGKEHTLVVTEDGALWACGKANCPWFRLFSDDDNSNVSTTFKKINKFDGHSDQKKVVSVASSLFLNDKQSVLTMEGIFEWLKGQDREPIKLNPSNRSNSRNTFEEKIAYIITETESKMWKKLFSSPDILATIKSQRRNMEQERNDVHEGLRRLKGDWVPKSEHQSVFAKVTVCSSCLLKISNANLTLKT